MTDRMMTAKDVARRYGWTVGSVKRAMDSGRLRSFKMGAPRYTRSDWVDEFVCRESERPRVCTSTGSAGNGLSGTDRASSALASLNQTVRGLRNNWLDFLPPNTNRRAGPTR